MIDLKLAHVFLDDKFYITDTDAFENEGYSLAETNYYNINKFNIILEEFFESLATSTYEKYKVSCRNGERYLDSQIESIRKVTSNSVNSFKEFSKYFK